MDDLKPIDLLPNEVQKYAEIIRQEYNDQPIVVADWPPKIGQDYFGRLVIVEKESSSIKSESKMSAWHMLRGQIDVIPTLSGYKEVTVENDVLCPDSSSPVRVLIDGPPGIGKTTLCHKLLKMWSNGELIQHYDLILYCPLRNEKIATANTFEDLFENKCHEVAVVTKWFEEENGKGLLIIFDGWDELNSELRQSSLATSIIKRKHLCQSSVVVTSRSHASSKLSRITSFNKQFQVIGFSEEEISRVIIQTLQEDGEKAKKILEEIIIDPTDYEEGYDVFDMYPCEFEAVCTNDPDETSQLAVKLINDLRIRKDVQSLCYVPLVCSMVVIVYCKNNGQLPMSLTELYENFILQTIRRHVEKRPTNEIDAYLLDSLSSLPTQLLIPFKELCHLAYISLAETKMTFSSSYLRQFASEAVKEEYLGMITTFREYDEEIHQFIHLTIQEFLAAWWIVKYETDTEKIFKVHFNDDHFRMCLRFVAGLSHLEDESYQKYFSNVKYDLQCKRNSLFRFKARKCSTFYSSSPPASKCKTSPCEKNDEIILLLQLLYESQNQKLCHIFSQSFTNLSICLKCLNNISRFDWLCFSFFINNSQIKWNHLHLKKYSLGHSIISIFTAELTNNSQPMPPHCERLDVFLNQPTDQLVIDLLKPLPIQNIQECYCDFYVGSYTPSYALLQFLCLPQIKILHVKMQMISQSDDEKYTEMCSEQIKQHKTLKEMNLNCCKLSIVISIIKGLANNKTIKSFTAYETSNMMIDILLKSNLPHFLSADTFKKPSLSADTFEELLQNNTTLQALSLRLLGYKLPQLDVQDVNMQLKALEIDATMSPLLPHIKGLCCLILPICCSPQLIFDSHPKLRQLTISIDTAEHATELFNILQTNDRLKLLRVEIGDKSVFTSSIGTSLQDMLKQNKKIQCFEILTPNCKDEKKPFISINKIFLSSLLTGLVQNNVIEQLSLPIELETTTNKQIKALFDVISQKSHLNEIQVYFTLDNNNDTDKMSELFLVFYEQCLPTISNMLQSDTTIKLMKIVCNIYGSNETAKPECLLSLGTFSEAIVLNRSLEYIKIDIDFTLSILMRDIIEEMKDTIKEREASRQLPKIELNIGTI